MSSLCNLAGVNAVQSLAQWGGPNVCTAILQAGTAAELVELTRSTDVASDVFRYATSALGSLSAYPEAVPQMFDPLVAYLQPSSPAAAHNAATALFNIAGNKQCCEGEVCLSQGGLIGAFCLRVTASTHEAFSLFTQ